jgi:hypothetical protein
LSATTGPTATTTRQTDETQKKHHGNHSRIIDSHEMNFILYNSAIFYKSVGQCANKIEILFVSIFDLIASLNGNKSESIKKY